MHSSSFSIVVSAGPQLPLGVAGALVSGAHLLCSLELRRWRFGPFRSLEVKNILKDRPLLVDLITSYSLTQFH